jgi:hypothetical protein
VAASERSTGGTIVISRRLVNATAIALVVLVGSAAAITAASMTRLARTEIELAAARATAGSTPAPTASIAGASPSPAAPASTSPSSSPTGSTRTEIEAALTTQLLESCISPLRNLAAAQEARLNLAVGVIAVYGSTGWDGARDNAISGYSTAYTRMRSAADVYRSRLIEQIGGQNASTAPPSSYGAAISSAATALGQKGSMDNLERPIRNIATNFATASPLATVVATAKECPQPQASGSPAPSSAP